MTTIKILFDHPDFIVVNKPINISVQNETGTLGIISLLCKQLNVEQLWLVHRLDKVTSGLLIVAKNATSAALFGQIFEQKKIEKFYLAISAKKPKKKQGMIKGGMKKVRDGKWMLEQNVNSLAVSQFFSYSLMPGFRLFLVKPLTGKTHQIRVALKSIGSPILGDNLYKGGAADRTYLHAFCVQFMYKNEQISVVCQPDIGELFTSEETRMRLEKLQQPSSFNWPVYTFAS